MDAKPKILVFSNIIPRPDKSSGELRFVSILEMLSAYWDIDFCVATSHAESNASKERVPYFEKLNNNGIRVLPVKKDTFENAVRENQYVGAYFNLYWIAEEMMPLFTKAFPSAFTIVDSVDVHYAREESQAKLGEISYSKVLDTKKRELRVYKSADVVIAVSKEDFQLLFFIEKIRNVFLVPNIVSVYPRLPGKRKPIVIFIGCYAWYPNPGAVKWFAHEIWPAVHEAVPEAEFMIIGSDPTEEVIALSEIPGIKVVGYVPETKLYLDIAAVSVAPLRIGGGMKGKVNEAMAHGVPVVATTIGSQGFEAEHGKQIMITDDPSEFASYVIMLLRDDELQREIGLAGQHLNSVICSHEVVAKKIGELTNHCSSLISRQRDYNLRKWFNLYHSKILLITSDIGHGIRLLKREGPGKFIRRTLMYLHGQRFDTPVHFEKKEHIIFELPEPSKIIEFPALKEYPLASIIIPVYNQWHYTYACLDSILKNSGDIKYEIILADDNSTDDTRFAEKFIKNIRVIRNKENLGFLFNCNKSAKFAKGKYIILLYNDTLVQPDWLKWFMKTMEEKPDVGLAGAKLVFANGKLQEAGGIVFKDGSAMNYGREDNHDQHQYNYFKDVDYCSGACICIRKELWIKAGGFDPIYAPAYYEDTDLAMQIRIMGYRTVYQPKSLVLHFEGMTHGIDITQGIKKKQDDNQMVFYEKWKDELEKNNYERDENLFKARDKSKNRQTVLLIDHCVPDSSGQILNHFLGMNYNIKFLPGNFKRTEPGTSAMEQKGIEILYGDSYRDNWTQWVIENSINIDLICFIDESLNLKFLPLLKKILPENFKYNVYDDNRNIT